jgi:hypothetical protein
MQYFLKETEAIESVRDFGRSYFGARWSPAFFLHIQYPSRKITEYHHLEVTLGLRISIKKFFLDKILALV